MGGRCREDGVPFDSRGEARVRKNTHRRGEEVATRVRGDREVAERSGGWQEKETQPSGHDGARRSGPRIHGYLPPHKKKFCVSCVSMIIPKFLYKILYHHLYALLFLH